MNDLFDPNEPSDAALTAALQTLPEPPEHRADFWSSLEADLADAESDQPTNSGHQPRRNGRAQFLLVAAALVIVAGVIGVVATNQTGDNVTVADQPTVTEAPPTTTAPDLERPEPGDRPFINTDGRALVGVTADGYLVDELFGYDLLLPSGFTVDFPSTYGSYATDPDNPAAGSIQTVNSFAADDRSTEMIRPLENETLVETNSVDMPLYESINDSVELAESTVTADQFVFDRGIDGQRVARVIRLDERVIVIDVVSSDPDFFAEAFDGFRIYEGPVAKGDACSTLDAAPLAAPSELNPAQTARFEAIMTALTTCDWDLLEAQLNPTGFSASIAGGEAIEIWTRQERYGDPVLRTLYDHLAFPVGVDEVGEAQWPRQWASFDGFDDETLAALVASEYYREAELPSWDEMGYFGWRTGIDADGNWNYFIVGD